MRKLLKIYSLRNLMLQFPKHNYSVYRRIQNIEFLSVSKISSPSKIHCCFSTLSSPHDAVENGIQKLQKEFQNPKKILYEVLNEVFIRDQTLDLKPSITTEYIQADSENISMWKARIQMKWPQAFQIESLARRKSDALNNCFLHTCQKLKDIGVLDDSNKPLLQKRKYNDHELKSAKGDLINLHQKIWHRTGNRECMPKFNTRFVPGLYGNYWQTELHLFYPEEKIVTGAALRSTSAEAIAAYEALLWLTNQGIINKKRRLVEYTKNDEIKLREFHDAPYSICIPSSLQNKMQTVLTEIEEEKLLLSKKVTTECTDPIEVESSEDLTMRDLITEVPFYQLTEQQFYDRSRYLFEKNKSVQRKYLQELSDMKIAKCMLPVSSKREDILKLLDENQVVILSGDTGCGKSTQVPQFILNHYIDNMKGAGCNIVITQPRRISALALADRIAKERGERIGDIVGHHIRLSKCLPEGKGAILFCTTGMLLRKMISNPNLEGISHIIIDEVHERNIHIDFLLILLKNILEKNKDIKLLLMSASFNTNLFAQYFNSAATIHIPGRMHHVEEYFLEDLVDVISSIKTKDRSEATLDVDLIVDTISHIVETQPPGAILCFLPGWHDIRCVHTKLLENEKHNGKILIYPIHSRLPYEEQKNIFLKPPEDVRKIILATNIAETAVTIDDVVYVVNSGLHKGTVLNAQISISSLSTQWITKANVRQRRGRAGRVKPGKCYHLFSWKTYMKMEEYPVPEIVRTPLERVILDSKLHCPGSKAEEFLSKGLQPPITSAIQCGINELQILGILDENENLTDLGNTVLHFSTHPRLSVAIVYATFLGCLDPVLTICSILTMEKEPFENTLDDKLMIRKIKEIHDNGLCSDHLALRKIYETWLSLKEEDTSQYIEENLLDDKALVLVKELKELFAEDLFTAGLIHDASSYCDSSSQYNAYNSHVPSILAALTAAFSPNVIKILQGEITHGKLSKDSLVYHIIKGQKAFIQKESVASGTEEFPTPWLVYFSALQSEARRKTMVSAVSAVPGICLLLLAGREMSMTNMVEGNLAVLSIDDYKKLKFSCTDKEARLLLDWRECIHEVFKLYTQYLKQNCAEREYMLSWHSKLIPVLKELLETPQVPFTKGYLYEFVDNELITKQI